MIPKFNTKSIKPEELRVGDQLIHSTLLYKQYFIITVNWLGNAYFEGFIEESTFEGYHANRVCSFSYADVNNIFKKIVTPNYNNVWNKLNK